MGKHKQTILRTVNTADYIIESARIYSVCTLRHPLYFPTTGYVVRDPTPVAMQTALWLVRQLNLSWGAGTHWVELHPFVWDMDSFKFIKFTPERNSHMTMYWEILPKALRRKLKRRRHRHPGPNAPGGISSTVWCEPDGRVRCMMGRPSNGRW